MSFQGEEIKRDFLLLLSSLCRWFPSIHSSFPHYPLLIDIYKCDAEFLNKNARKIYTTPNQLCLLDVNKCWGHTNWFTCLAERWNYKNGFIKSLFCNTFLFHKKKLRNLPNKKNINWWSVGHQWKKQFQINKLCNTYIAGKSQNPVNRAFRHKTQKALAKNTFIHSVWLNSALAFIPWKAA